MAFEFIPQALLARREQGLLRQRACIDSAQGALIEVEGQHYLNFSSNDYLGMRQAMPVLQGWAEGLSVYGAGSGASPLVTGYTSAHQALEEYLAEGLGREKVLLFNSGFAANQALCQALCPKGVNLIADKLIHASVIDGALACEGSLKRFRHNDMTHLAQLLEASAGSDCLVASEGIFSMDGDAAPVQELAALSQQHNAWLMLDDAHGMGILGERGFGSAEAYGLSQQQLPVLMGTFGKAIGTAGAFVAGSSELIDYLVNFARHYVYSTAMSPAQAIATLASFQSIAKGQQRQLLEANIAQFKQGAQALGLHLLPSNSPIQPVIIGEPNKALAASQALKKLGIWVSAIRSPTVPKGTDRLRITLTAAHTEQDIQALLDVLALTLNKASL